MKRGKKTPDQIMLMEKLTYRYLTQGRSYRVASHLATQNRALIGANAGKDAKNFIDLVSTNARNQIIYGGGNYEDANFYSKQFGEILERKIERGISRSVMNPLYGFGHKTPTESIREVEKNIARYSPSDLIFKDFGYVTYCIIKNKSIQPPGVSRLNFISKEVKTQIDAIVEDYKLRELSKDDELSEKEEISNITIEASPIDGVLQSKLEEMSPLLQGGSFSEIDMIDLSDEIEEGLIALTDNVEPFNADDLVQDFMTDDEKLEKRSPVLSATRYQGYTEDDDFM